MDAPRRSPEPTDLTSRSNFAVGPTPYSLLLMMMLPVIGLLVTVSQFIAHWRVDVVDDQLFGYFGWRIVHGATVYLDIWDNKPPGIYWINALGFLVGGDSYRGVVALCAMAIVGSLVAFFFICQSLMFRDAAAVGTVLAAFYITHGYYQAGTNRTETFLILFELVAVLLYMRGWVRDRWWTWLAAGVCCGCAFLCKQVGLAAWGAMGLHTILVTLGGALPWLTGARRCVLLLAGAALPVGLAAGALAAQGALAEAWFATVGFNRYYFEIGRSSFSNTFYNRFTLQYMMFDVLKLPILMTIASVLHATLWWLRPHLRPREIAEPLAMVRPVCPNYMLLFAIWFAAAFYGAALSPHAFEHYLVPTLPPLMLMSTYLVNVLLAEVSLIRRLQQYIWVTACFVAMGYFAISSWERHIQAVSRVALFRGPWAETPRLASWEMVGEQAARLSGPNDTIQCIGYLPGAYLHARRISASRYATTEKIGQLEGTEESERIRQVLIRDLSAALPAVIAMDSFEYNATMEPSIEWPARSSLSEWLSEFLPRHYEPAVELRQINVILLQRKDLRSADAKRELLDMEPPPE